MDIFPYTIKELLTNHHTYLTELKNFALAQGWTVVRHLTNVQWAFSGGIWQFITGQESFLELSSTGYGGQTLHYRFRMEHTGSVTNEYMHTGGHLGNTTLQNVSTHPVDQTGVWTSTGFKYMGLLPTNIPKVWFFGNNKFILAAIQLDNDYVQYHSFGSLKLFDTTMTQGNFFGWVLGSQAPWTSKSALNPFDSFGDVIYFNNARQSSSNSKQNFICQPNNTLFAASFDFDYGSAIVQNAFAVIRPIVPQKYYQLDNDSLWFNFAEAPVGRIWSENLAIGQEVQYGTAKYLVFPKEKQASTFLGIAVRVA